jgi:fructokinase
MVSETELVAGIELGGTKAVVLLARGTTIIARERIPTTDPGATLAAATAWLAAAAVRHGAFAALGIASFGPLGLDPALSGHGTILATPKPGWSGTPLLAHFARTFAVPIGLDTDVNAAALAEARWGGGRGGEVVVYLTIGTGLGGGIIVGGRPLHGRLHPEIGHIRVRRRAGDGFTGVCPWHGDCIEGLICGPALVARGGMPADAQPPDHPIWAAYIDDLAELLAILVLTVSPDRILIGGGVGMAQAHLLPRLRAAMQARLASYLPAMPDNLVDYPQLGDDAGPLGAIALAHDALKLLPVPAR